MLRRGSLPPPLHLAGALARYPHLTLRQRLAAARAALALARLDPREASLDRLTFGDWLARHGQDPRAVSVLWDLIALPTLNLPAAQASLALGAFVFRTGLLSGADAGDIGFHAGTLAETIGEPAERALTQAGVEVKLGWRAERLQRAARGVEVQAGEDGLSAEVAIVALGHTRAGALLAPLLPQLALALAEMGSSPIVNLHVVYDRPVCEEPFAAGVGTPVQYLFDRTAAAGAPAGCQYLAVSLSGAEREMRMSVDALRERFLPALRDLLPRARGAKVERFLATREHAATFRAAPGVSRFRPGAETSVAEIVLAGAWTDTGWPATLEGAVLSGHTAADAALRVLEIEPDGRAGGGGTRPAGANAGERRPDRGAPASGGPAYPLGFARGARAHDRYGPAPRTRGRSRAAQGARRRVAGGWLLRRTGRAVTARRSHRRRGGAERGR